MFIISPSKSKLKRFFDITILFLVGYSCITSLYYVAFSKNNVLATQIWEGVVELLFLTDLVLNFLTEFIDEYTYTTVREFKPIAIKYL